MHPSLPRPAREEPCTRQPLLPGDRKGHGHHSGSQAHKSTREVRAAARGTQRGRLLRKGQERREQAGRPPGHDGSSAGRRVTRAGGRGARAPDPRVQRGAGRWAQLANSLPLSLPQERGTGTRCAALENSWGTSPTRSPAPPPFLPRPPPRPVQPLPACPATPWPAGPLRAARRAGWRAGGRRVTRPRTWRTRLGRRSHPGGQGRKKRRPRAPGRGELWTEIREIPASPPRCATRGPCCRAARSGRALLPAPAALGAGCSFTRPAFSAPPAPHSGAAGAAAPPPSPFPGRRDPGSAGPAPGRLQRDPWRLGGPLAPQQLLTSQRCRRTLTPGRPPKSKMPSRPALGPRQAWAKALRAWAAETQVATPTSRFRAHCIPFGLRRSSRFSFLKMTRALERGRGEARTAGCGKVGEPGVTEQGHDASDCAGAGEGTEAPMVSGRANQAGQKSLQ